MATHTDIGPDPARPAAPSGAGWRLGWAAAAGATAALVLIVFGGAPLTVFLALACLALPAVAELCAPPRTGRWGEGRAVLWACSAGAAVALTGGLAGPLSMLLLAPLLACAVGGGALRPAGYTALAAAAFVAVLGLVVGLPLPGDQALRALLALAGCAVVLGFGVAALAGERRLALPLVQPRAEPARRPAQPDADLTARLEAAEAARAQAEADARGKMRFLANMSHELRTPLNAIIGFSDIMRARLFGELPPRYAEYAELIHESGGHLLDLINDLLDVSKIEADRYVLARESFDAREAVQAALRLVRQQADDAGVQLRGLLPPEPLEIDADRRAIKQIVLNLVANALKFTPSGGSATVSLAAAEGQLEIAVSDTGVGIAPEDLQRLGRPYEQAGSAQDRARGTGLGLSLVRAFARLHGGELMLESRLGEGTAAIVRLPVLVTPPTPVSETSDTAEPLGALRPA